MRKPSFNTAPAVDASAVSGPEVSVGPALEPAAGRVSVAILADGDFPVRPYPRYLLEQADHVVVCDGALRKWIRTCPDRMPDAVVGDMDSLSAALRRRFADRIHAEAEQETNDLSKALRYVLAHIPEATEIHILGATGRREDHTLGNLALLMEYARQYGLGGLTQPSVDMVSDYTTAFAITDSCSLAVGEGRAVSLFSPDNSLTICSQGLVWPTDEVVFDNWWKATLNRACADTVALTFSHPSIALVVLA